MMKRVFLLFFLVSTVLAGGYAAEIGNTAPIFANSDLSGEFHFSDQVYGDKWVLLYFFASWCEPCEKELADLEFLLEEVGSSRLTGLLFFVDADGYSAAAPYFRKNPTSFTVLLDSFMVTAQRFGVREVPVLFCVSPDGVLVKKQIGYSETVADELRAFLFEFSKVSLIDDGLH